MKPQKLLIIVLLLAGCGTTPPQRTEVSDLKRQIFDLQKTVGLQSSQIEDLNNKILLLKDKVDNKVESSLDKERPLPPTVSLPAQDRPATQPMAQIHAPGPGQAPVPTEENENPDGNLQVTSLKAAAHEAQLAIDKLYGQTLLSARQSHWSALEKNVEQILKEHRDSPLANNALFLLAQTFYDRGQYNKSAAQFERLYKMYPDGNKAVAALYGLGLCYEKMGQGGGAQEAFQNVLTVYPGSREAIEAEKHLKKSEGSREG